MNLHRCRFRHVSGKPHLRSIAMLRAHPFLPFVLMGLLLLSGCGTEGGSGQQIGNSSIPPPDLGAPRYASPATSPSTSTATAETTTDTVAGTAVVPAAAPIPDQPQE